VPAWLKRQAYAEYGITQYKTGDYEVDHTGNEVWVKTRSGKYWKPGSRFYGKTKQGESMPESDALDRILRKYFPPFKKRAHEDCPHLKAAYLIPE